MDSNIKELARKIGDAPAFPLLMPNNGIKGMTYRQYIWAKIAANITNQFVKQVPKIVQEILEDQAREQLNQ